MSGFDVELLNSFASACAKLRSGGAGASSLHQDVADLMRRPGVWTLCSQVLEEGAEEGLNSSSNSSSAQGAQKSNGDIRLLDTVSVSDRIYFIFLAAKVVHTLIAKRWAHCEHENRAYLRNVIFSAVLRNSFGPSSPVSRMLQRSMALLLLLLPSRTEEDMETQRDTYYALASAIKSGDIDVFITVLRTLGEVGEELRTCDPDKFAIYGISWRQYRSMLICVLSYSCVEVQAAISSQSRNKLGNALKILGCCVSSLSMWSAGHDKESDDDDNKFDDPLDDEASGEDDEGSEIANEVPGGASQSALLCIDDLMSVSDPNSEVGSLFLNLFNSCGQVSGLVFLETLELLFRLPNAFIDEYQIFDCVSEMLQVLMGVIQVPQSTPSAVLYVVMVILRCWEIVVKCSLSDFMSAIGVWAVRKQQSSSLLSAPMDADFVSQIQLHLKASNLLWNKNMEDEDEKGFDASPVLIVLIEMSMTICERFGDIVFQNDLYNDIRSQVFSKFGHSLPTVANAKTIRRQVFGALISWVCIIPDVSCALMATEILSNIGDYGPSEYLAPLQDFADESVRFSSSTVLLVMEHMRFTIDSSLSSAVRAAILGTSIRSGREKDLSISSESIESILEYRRESYLIVTGAWKYWNSGRAVLLKEFEYASCDARDLFTILDAAFTSTSKIPPFLDIECGKLPDALRLFSRVLFQLETRIICMAWVGGTLVECEEAHTVGCPSTSSGFVSAKSMYAAPQNKGNKLSNDALLWLHSSISLTAELARLIGLLEEHKSDSIYPDFNAVIGILRFSFGELWVSVSSILKRYCISTDNEADLGILRKGMFEAMDILLLNSDLQIVSNTMDLSHNSLGNRELLSCSCEVAILDKSLTALEALLMSFAGETEGSSESEEMGESTDVKQVDWLLSHRNILASQDAVSLVLQKIVQKSPLLSITSIISLLGASGSISLGYFNLKQFKGISRKFGNCCGRLVSIVLSQEASIGGNHDVLIRSNAWTIAVQLTEAQFNCLATEIQSIKCSIASLVCSNREASFSSVAQSCLTGDTRSAFVNLASTNPSAVVRATLMCSLVAWGARCVLSHIDGYLFGLSRSGRGIAFLAEHFRCPTFQNLVFRTAGEELCNASRLVAVLSVVSSRSFPHRKDSQISSLLGSLEALHFDMRSLNSDAIQLIEDLEISTKHTQWTEEYSSTAIDQMYLFLESLSINSNFTKSLVSATSSASTDVTVRTIIMHYNFPAPVLHLLSSYAIQVQRLHTDFAASFMKRLIGIAAQFVCNISEAYRIALSFGGSDHFKLIDIEGLGLSCLKLFPHLFRVCDGELWLALYSVETCSGAVSEPVNLVRLLCRIASQIVFNECTKRFESKGSHADSLRVIQAVSSSVKAIVREATSGRSNTSNVFELEWAKSIPELFSALLFMLIICKEGRASRGNVGIQTLDVLLQSLANPSMCPSGLVAADHVMSEVCTRLEVYLNPSFKTEVVLFGVKHEISAAQALGIVKISLFKYVSMQQCGGNSGGHVMRLSTIIESLSHLIANAPSEGKNRLAEWCAMP